MNHEKTHQTDPMAPWNPLDALLTPWQPPNQPPQTHKEVPWPHCTPKITSTASKITFTFIPVTPVVVVVVVAVVVVVFVVVVVVIIVANDHLEDLASYN